MKKQLSVLIISLLFLLIGGYFFFFSSDNNLSEENARDFGIQNIETIKKGINQYENSDGNIEVLIHPGYTNIQEKKKFYKKYFKYYSSLERLKEFEIVSSKNFIKRRFCFSEQCRRQKLAPLLQKS